MYMDSVPNLVFLVCSTAVITTVATVFFCTMYQDLFSVTPSEEIVQSSLPVEPPNVDGGLIHLRMAFKRFMKNVLRRIYEDMDLNNPGLFRDLGLFNKTDTMYLFDKFVELEVGRGTSASTYQNFEVIDRIFKDLIYYQAISNRIACFRDVSPEQIRLIEEISFNLLV
jgi:hypothetical protein